MKRRRESRSFEPPPPRHNPSPTHTLYSGTSTWPHAPILDARTDFTTMATPATCHIRSLLAHPPTQPATQHTTMSRHVSYPLALGPPTQPHNVPPRPATFVMSAEHRSMVWSLSANATMVAAMTGSAPSSTRAWHASAAAVMDGCGEHEGGCGARRRERKRVGGLGR